MGWGNFLDVCRHISVGIPISLIERFGEQERWPCFVGYSHRGHPACIKEVCPNKDGTWTPRLSHTNYSRRCHLDLDTKVIVFSENNGGPLCHGALECLGQ